MIMRELKPLPVFRNDGVQRAVPAPADDFRRIDRVRTAAHGPENIVDIIDIDVVVRRRCSGRDRRRPSIDWRQMQPGAHDRGSAA